MELQALLEQFVALEDDEAVGDFLRAHEPQLLTEEAEQWLGEMAAAASDDGQRERLEARLQWLQLLRQMRVLEELSPEERLFLFFRSVSNDREMVNLAMTVDDEPLDELEQIATTRQAAESGDDAEAIRQRLEGLRRARQMLQSAHGALLPLVRRLHAWIQTDSWDESEAYLAEHAGELLTDAGEAALGQMVAQAPQNPVLQQHEALLRACRERGIAAAYAERADDAPQPTLDPQRAQALAERLVAWIRQETLTAAEAYLQEHETELLTEEALIVMQLLVKGNPGNPDVLDHAGRLGRAVEVGVAAMYIEIRQQRAWEALQEAVEQQGQVGQLLWGFLMAESEAEAQAHLAAHAPLLHREVGTLLDSVLEVAPQLGNEALLAQWQARRQLWQRASLERQAPPLRDADESREPPSPREEGQRQYTILSATHCAIGDNAMTFNHIEMTPLPLRWQRPAEGKSHLASAAVGREAELADLHERLSAGQGAAVVSQGTTAALRGQPAVGKTTLAAMYVARYGQQYRGGVLWLDVGPQQRDAASVAPTLQRIATYAYQADAQALKLLENTIFAAEVVRALLSPHGPLLVVVDDVWDPAALREIRAALPQDASVLLTTRDYKVAYALEGRKDAIQELDVLSPEDARLLLQRGAPGLSDALADQVAQGLGRHALALTLAAAALALPESPHRYEAIAAELLARVAEGRGFGYLPYMDETEQQTEVEIALKYSYDYLGERAQGAAWQGWFRALGTFAQEADFGSGAAAFVWGQERATAEEFLLLLKRLSLIQESGTGSRWQQHALLRAYALSLQAQEERVHLPERHADYYIALAERCYESKPRDYERVEREFAQLQHAFGWCERESPLRATRLTGLLSDFMTNRGRVPLLSQWLESALHGSELYGDRLGKANTLMSLGDLESRLGNIEQARAHYDAALPLYDVEQDRLGKANTLRSLGDLESRLGNLEQARAHYDAALPLYDVEQARLGKANTLISLGDLESRLGNIEQARAHYDAAQTLYELEQEPGGLMNTWISLAQLEVGLGRVAEADSYYQRTLALAERSGFAAHPVVQGWREEYQKFQMVRQSPPAQDPLALALAALFQVDSAESFQRVLQAHPALLELHALTHLTEAIGRAHSDGQPQMALRLLVLLLPLLDLYNHAHVEQIDLDEHERFIHLHDTLLPIADALGDADLIAGLRRSAGWALNTLGNQHAARGAHEQAVATYSRALGHAPANAMLYRNRAGEYIEMAQYDLAQADIEEAARLEPEAARLAELRQALHRGTNPHSEEEA